MEKYAKRERVPVNTSMRPLWLSWMLLFSLIAGIFAGWLSWAAGQNPFAAALTGGGTFGGSMLLLLAIFHFIAAERQG